MWRLISPIAITSVSLVLAVDDGTTGAYDASPIVEVSACIGCRCRRKGIVSTWKGLTMARKRKSEGDIGADEHGGDTASLNASNRAEIIRGVCRDLAAMEEERKSLTAGISELKQERIKGDLGMKIADFAVVYRLYGLEQEDRDTLFDTLRETFDALGVGMQLGFLDALKEQKDREQAAGLGDPSNPKGGRRAAAKSNGVAPENEDARRDGLADGAEGTDTHAGLWPQGTPGHASYVLATEEAKRARSGAEA